MRWRFWAYDPDEHVLEVLKVPAHVSTDDPMEYLFTEGELDELISELRTGNLRLYKRERISRGDLESGAVTLYGPLMIGEADYYVRCKHFIAMANDPKRGRSLK